MKLAHSFEIGTDYILQKQEKANNGRIFISKGRFYLEQPKVILRLSLVKCGREQPEQNKQTNKMEKKGEW